MIDDRYTRTAIALHWLIALTVVVQFAWGWWMQSIPKDPPGMRVDAFNLHKSIGLTLFALMALRVIWRVAHPPPPLPAMPQWQSRLAHFNHLLLYAALFAMPLAGYLGSVFSGYPVKYFGITLPSWGVKNAGLKDLFSAVHYAASWVLAGAVALHLAGVAKHAFIDRDGLLGRMGLRVHPRLKRAGHPRSRSAT
jgi:cytochrome b561